MIVFRHRGNFNHTEKFLKGASSKDYRSILEQYAQEGVNALSAATPVESGKTAASWGYDISMSHGGYSISWTNSNVVEGVPIAIILQYGHGTGTGGYVQGRDYINPAIRPIFDRMGDNIWKEVTRL